MDALSEYGSRQRAAGQAHAALEKRSRQIGNVRLGTALLFVLVAWLALTRHASAWLLSAPAGGFAWLLIWHTRVRQRSNRASRVADWYATGIARIQDNWSGNGPGGERFIDPQQPFAQDIDLFGRGSLFQLLSQARTTVGQSALADWLLHAALPAEVAVRQEAVQELSTALDLREDLMLIGSATIISDPSRLMEWSTEAPVAVPRFAPALAAVLAIVGVGSAVAAVTGRAPLFPFAIVFAASVSFAVWLRNVMTTAVSGLDTSAADLDAVSVLVARVEREEFRSPRLEQLRSALEAKPVPASARIARLRRWVELLDSTDHILLRMVNPILLLRQQFAYAIARWRRENGRFITSWLQAVADFEALSSLAALRYERPNWTFPTIAASAEPVFRARSLTHALLAANRAVANEVDLGERTRLLIVSGSNMSGKSTLLRSVGIATVLAFAGAPVPAAELTLSPLQVGASLRNTDSLQDNRSRFMAELLRLQQIVALTQRPVPVLFLLDELLSGTNSHDRRIGASAIVRDLIDAGAIGLITTHDLALTAIADELPGAAENVHFTDEIEGGELHFDYRLRPGIVTHSNALELMRAVGLLPHMPRS